MKLTNTLRFIIKLMKVLILFYFQTTLLFKEKAHKKAKLTSIM